MKIGFLGFGEAACCISLGLRGEAGNALEIRAFDILRDDPRKGAEMRRRAEEAGVELVAEPREAAAGTDVFFSAVPSAFAFDACRSVLPVIRDGQIYADVSASTPATKENIWKLLEPCGAFFADAAMLGSLPKDRHRVPITASGNGAKAFRDAMAPLGMRIALAGERPGAASAIKLMRSVYMKGIAACMLEMLQGANVYNVRDEVVSSIAQSLDGISFVDHLDRLVTGTAVHAKRRAEEMKGSEKMLEECGLDAVMSKATRRKHELVSECDFSPIFENKNPGWRDVVEIMRQNGREVAECR